MIPGRGPRCPVCENHISGPPDHNEACPHYGKPVSEIDTNSEGSD